MAFANSDFSVWMQENNLDVEDLELIKKTAAKRAWIFFFLANACPYIFLPFFLREWTWYKMMKQGTTTPRYGLIYSIYNLAMLITFIMILPIVLWAVFYKGTSLSGYSFLMKKGFIGQGSQGRENFVRYKEIKKHPAKVRNLVCLIVTAVCILAFYIIGLFDGSYSEFSFIELIDIFVTATVSIFITSEIIGLIVTKIIVNKRYYNS